MKFNLEAAKAYMGGVVATAGPALSNFIVGAAEASTGIDIPTSVEGVILTAITFVLGFLGVYFTPNKAPAA